MVGQNIGKYQVLERVGRGGMGTVYRAIDETLHREVAIKVLNAELNDPEVAKRFRAEAITVARLSHPGIATIYELFQHEGQWLMVMEFVRGETIEGLVERMGPLSPQRSAELCMQALASLAHAHSMGVVHRDLKPANMMITETGAIKIMDFGIARVAGTEHLTNAGFMMGTPSYMAPEQVMGREIDARADLYAMGVVFYRLVTAKLPFKGDTPFAMAQSQVNDPPLPVGTFRADLPSWVEQVVVRSLAKSPEERFQSAVEFHEAFARCLAGLPMASLYSSSAPTELIMTPPRAMPTGSIHRTMTSMQVPVQTPLPHPTTAEFGGSSTGAQSMPETMMTPSGGSAVPPVRTPIRTEAMPASAVDAMGAFAPGTPVQTPVSTPVAGTGGYPAPLTPTPTPPAAGTTGPEKAAAPGKAKGAGGLVAIAAAAIVIAGIGGAFWYRSHRRAAAEAAAIAAASQTAPVPDASQPLVPAPAAPPPATVVPPPIAPVAVVTPSSDPGRSAGRAPAASATSAGASTPASAVSSGASTSAPATGRATPAATNARVPATDDSHQAFTDVKVLTSANGKKTDDQDVVLSFVGGQVSALSTKSDVSLSFADGHVTAAKADANAAAALPYKAILHATYVHARDPKWSDAYFGPPKDLDVGGMLRSSKHFLVLQTKDSYMILRLDDSNVLRVLQTIESHTGLTIDRPQQADKQPDRASASPSDKPADKPVDKAHQSPPKP